MSVDTGQGFFPLILSFKVTVRESRSKQPEPKDAGGWSKWFLCSSQLIVREALEGWEQPTPGGSLWEMK